MSWAHYRACGEHGLMGGCDCGPELKHDLWRLLSDAGDVLGAVQSFQGEEGPFYGTTDHDRTGAMGDLLQCQAAVERMVKEERER